MNKHECIRTNYGRCEGKECSPDCAEAFFQQVVSRIFGEVAERVAERVVARLGGEAVPRD